MHIYNVVAVSVIAVKVKLIDTRINSSYILKPRRIVSQMRPVRLLDNTNDIYLNGQHILEKMKLLLANALLSSDLLAIL